jgi:hypothetical protein
MPEKERVDLTETFCVNGYCKKNPTEEERKTEERMNQ